MSFNRTRPVGTDLSCLALAVTLLWPFAATAAKHPNTCPPAPDQVIVRFTYGSEKAAWIYDVTKDFNAKGVQTTSGKRICIHAIPKGSGDSVNEIKNAQAGPDEVHATGCGLSMMSFRGVCCNLLRQHEKARSWQR
jgi:Ca-activated chloride channel family protein